MSKLLLGGKIEGERGQDLVAIDQSTEMINRDATLSVAIIRDTCICLAPLNFRDQRGGGSRATADVNILPIRMYANRGYIAPRRAQQLRSDPRSRAVRAIDYHAQAGKSLR